MIRLFAGLDFSATTRTRLSGLCSGLPGARWIEPPNLHLTVRFIGPVDGSTACDVDQALSNLSFPPFTLTLDGMGTFGRGRTPHTLWVGTIPCPPMITLHKRIDSALVRLGIPPDTRQFSPHVTLARLEDKTPVARLHTFLAGNNLFREGPLPITDFVLFSSHPGGMYREEARYPLREISCHQPEIAPTIS